MSSSPSSPASSGAGGALTVNVSEEDSTLKVAVAGELDVSTVPAFNKQLSELRNSSATTLKLDLSGTTFMDSTGLSAVLVAEMHARMRGQRFVVVAGPPHVHELFKLTGVDNFLEVVGPEENSAA
jgi:anti-sigma B factor antagonist